VGTLPQELSFLQLTGKPVMVQRKKKPSGAQRKRLRKEKEAPYNSQRPPEVSNILTEVFIVPWGYTGGWTMGPPAAWFYEGQLHLHRNWN